MSSFFSSCSRRTSLLLLAAAMFGCTGEVPEPAAPAEEAVVCGDPAAIADAPVQNVILVTIDGARWQEIFGGVDPVLATRAGLPTSAFVSGRALMPHLHGLALSRGVALGAPAQGEPISASGPSFVSLPGYLEILSGRSRPSCTENVCPPTQIPTLADEVRACSGAGIDDVAVFSSWEGLERAASVRPFDILMSTGRHGGSHHERLRDDPVWADFIDGIASGDPAPGHGDYRRDSLTIAMAMHHLTVRRPRFLFLGLGDTDELAHQGDYGGYLEALRWADNAIGRLFDWLDASGDYGARTAVVITADHGRGPTFPEHGVAPESARSWLFAFGAPFAHGRIAKAPVPRALRDIAPTLRLVMGLPAVHGPGEGTPITEILGERPLEP